MLLTDAVTSGKSALLLWAVLFENTKVQYKCLLLALRPCAVSWFSQNLPAAWKGCRHKRSTGHV